MHHTLKKKPLRYEDLAEFVGCYKPANRHARKETWSEASPEGRWRRYGRQELLDRDKASLNLFWLKDKSRGGSVCLNTSLGVSKWLGRPFHAAAGIGVGSVM